MKSRRSFVSYMLGTSVGATVAAIIYPIIQFLIPPNIAEAQENSVTAGTIAELKPNTAKFSSSAAGRDY